MNEPMTAVERRRRLLERDPNLGIRVLLAIATDVVAALEAARRPELVFDDPPPPPPEPVPEPAVIESAPVATRPTAGTIRVDIDS
jgi:hypothetical protein